LTLAVERVWTFIDSQNLYRDTRRAFYTESDPSSYGQIDPIKLATVLVERGAASPGKTRIVDECRIYTGIPSADREPKSNAAYLRQRAAWEASGAKVFDRPLRYPKSWPKQRAEEKGVDVALAVDLVFNGARRNYDVGIVVSTDTDLVPALEAVCQLKRAWGAPRVEVACWQVLRKRLRVPSEPIWGHYLEEADYQLVRDTRSYVQP
jgi:uncharacterized LabA/DUF88 family protein